MKVLIGRCQFLLLATCLVWKASALADVSELTCQEEEENGAKNGKLICSFRVDPIKPVKDRLLKHCTDGVCVTAVASIIESSQSASQSTIKSNDDDSTNNEDQDDNLKVGIATYRKPYSEYYSPSISLWLKQAPKVTKINDPLGWAKWCGTLGSLHVQGYKGLYDLELAINALQESVQLVEDHFQIVGSESSADDDVWESFRASVYNTLGEAYYLDPNMSHGTEALDHYEKALAIYKSLVQKQDQASDFATEHDNTRQVYAMTLAKVGSALTQLHSIDTLEVDSLDGGDGMLADKTSTRTKMSTFNDHGSQSDGDRSTNNRSPKLQRAREVLTLAKDIYRTQCKEHLPATLEAATPRKGYQQHIPNPSAYVEACVDFATTLQYASRVETLAGNYEESLHYMKQALLVYTGEIDILLEESSVKASFVDAVLSNVYSIWYRMGSVDSIGSLLINIADTCGQLGRHNESKAIYTLAMRFYAKFNVAPPPTAQNTDGQIFGEREAMMNESTRAMVDTYLSMLKEYRRGIGSDANPEQLLYQKDDIYEGDILYNLGTIYVYAGDDKEGMEWLEEAVSVYQRTHHHKPGTTFNRNEKSNKSNQERWSQIASMKATLKRIYFGQRRFQDSDQAHQESMDLFRELYGEGVNPYIQILYEEAAQASGGTRSSNRQTANDDGSGETLDGGENNNNSINLENYLQSIQNATEKIEAFHADDPTKKQEL
ncbi:MAG: hypothetical protein SGBAC_008884 [Bacillariaceae sp.]